MIDFLQSNKASRFRQSLHQEYDAYLNKQRTKFDPKNCLKVDLHCHDHNSDVPDELWGRILGLPETWLTTNELVDVLESKNCDVPTITNHNNARSCWALQDQGIDVLVAAEFTCFFPEYDLFVHVLTYGFSREQEEILNKKRRNIYDFVRYCAVEDIPLILPHPLYFYTRNDKIDLDLFEKLSVMFQRFEVLNGQRDLWQSVLTLNWLESLTPEKLSVYAQKHNLNPTDFGVDITQPKILTGGSDCHMGIFAGDCGSQLYVPDLQQRLENEKPSDLALEAIKVGNIAPFGHVAENQKLNIALLDYFTQIASRMADPGLIRMMLHHGDIEDKVWCFFIGNFFLEIKKHKYTMKFVEFFHNALRGKAPSRFTKWQVSKDYRFFIDKLTEIANSKHISPEVFTATVNNAVSEMFTELNHLIIKRAKCSKAGRHFDLGQDFSTESLTRKLELPIQISKLFVGSSDYSQSSETKADIANLIDQLSFPVFITAILLGVNLASTRLLYQNRDFINQFAQFLGKNSHRERALYLTDTLRDKNGVSNSLGGKLAYIQENNLPIDFLICHEEQSDESNLTVLEPLLSFTVPNYDSQVLRVPNLMEIVRRFYAGGYDRIVCSTEGPMMVVALFLKQMFNVPCYFFMHTDWLDFVEHTTNLNHHERDRVRRLLRLMYKQFDGVFCLNSEHRDWLTGHQMQLDKNKVFLTAHHAKPKLPNILPIAKSSLFDDATQDTPILFIACRLSKEKGIMELPEILASVKRSIPNVKIVIAGSGPDKDELERALPEAKFMGWQSREQLAQLYSSLDLFVLPSQFDTFGNVILEAFTYGMPVAAYNCKGPKDIIEDRKSGFLVSSIDEMSQVIIQYFTSDIEQKRISRNAVLRAAQYQAQPIMDDFCQNLGFEQKDFTHDKRSIA